MKKEPKTCSYKSLERSRSNRERRVTIHWHSDSIKQLIEAVEEAECLWNVVDADYKNRIVKQTCWSNIAEQLGLSNKDVVDKWNSLRNTYRTALKTSAQSGNGRKPCFPYYEAMSFLQPIITIEYKGEPVSLNQSLSGSLSEVEDASLLSPGDLENISDASMFSETVAPKRIRSDDGNQRQELINSGVDVMNPLSSRKGDMLTDFGDYIASYLRTLQDDHPDLAMELQIGVNRALTKVQEKVLSRLKSTSRGTRTTHATEASQNIKHDKFEV